MIDDLDGKVRSLFKFLLGLLVLMAVVVFLFGRGTLSRYEVVIEFYTPRPADPREWADRLLRQSLADVVGPEAGAELAGIESVSLRPVRPPSQAEREETVKLLRARLAELAEEKWQAKVAPLADGTLLLSYSTSEGPGRLAEDLIPRGVCEFRFFTPDADRLNAALESGPPQGYVILHYLETCDGYNEQTGEPIVRLYPKLVEVHPVLAPRSFRDVSFSTKGLAKYSHVRFEFLPEDAERLARLSETQRGRALAVVVDGLVRIRLRVGPRTDDGVIEIHNLLDNAEIEKLVTSLRHGPLPTALRIKERRSEELR